MFKVRVPATSANMGPLFDTAGIALALYNTVEFYSADDIDIKGDYFIESVNNIDKRISAGQVIPTDKTNLIYSTMRCFAEEVGLVLPPVYIRQKDEIPLARGLGSSAACIAAGLLAANKLTGANLSESELLYMAVRSEGHPDNAAPAFLGGMVVGVYEKDNFEYVKINVNSELEFIALIPDFPLPTSKARNILPDTYTKYQTVFNCSHAALFVAAMMSGNLRALSLAMKDEIHQKYRQSLIPGMDKILSRVSELGCVGGFLSGAGPTVMVVNRKGNNVVSELEKIIGELENFWLVKPIDVDIDGALIID